MVRVLLVDDSASTRQVLTDRLSERGYEVTCADDGLHAAELALASPPDVVLTDLWMPGISGVQLCRILRAEPRTAHVPVILITGESQRRSRFWARTAGAVAYVAKDDPGGLFQALARVGGGPRPPLDSLRPTPRTSVQHRLFQRLDAALFESIVAGEIRALANEEGEAESVFRGLANLASEVAAYRWIAVHLRSPAKLFIHTSPGERRSAEAEARSALELTSEVEVGFVTDERPVASGGRGRQPPPLVAEVRAGGRPIATVAMGPGPRGASREDRELLSLVASELGGPLRIVSLVQESRRLAMSDPLTGLLNRRAFSELLARSLAAVDRFAQPVTVMLLDVDHFKRVNDTHGHEAGDAVLVGVADVLRAMARKTDFVARWGGEELVVALAHTAPAAAAIPAERVRRAIMEQRFVLPDGAEIGITASIGLAGAHAGDRVDSLIARADQAMYLAKAHGRNRCEFHDGRPSLSRLAVPTIPPVQLALAR